jgi:hypothetical protein
LPAPHPLIAIKPRSRLERRDLPSAADKNNGLGADDRQARIVSIGGRIVSDGIADANAADADANAFSIVSNNSLKLRGADGAPFG